MLPSELPDIGTRWTLLDFETTGLYPDEGDTITTVAVAWFDDDRRTIHSYAFPFDQGPYGKPEWDSAFYGQVAEDVPVLDADGQQVRYKSGQKAGQLKTRKVTRKLSADEVMPPDPNLGPDQWAALCRWLTERDIVAHNLLFELIMAQTGVNKPDMPGVDLLEQGVWCTMVGQTLLDPQHPRGLKETLARLRGDEEKDAQDAMKEWLRTHRLPVTKLGLAGWEVAEPYANKDAQQALWLARLQYLRIRGGEAKMSRMQQHLADLKTFVRMERRGIPYQAEQSLRWAEKLEHRVTELGQSLPFHPTPDKARTYFFGTEWLEKEMPDGSGSIRVPCLGLEPLKMTAGGEHKDPVPALDAEILQTLADRDVPNAKLYQEWKLVSDAVSKYYRGYGERIGRDGRLRTRFKQFGTETYRASCSRINVQAIPHDHRMLAGGSEIMALAPSPRALINPIPGYKIWHLDLKQAELRVAAQFADCTAMLEAIAEGKDLHAETAIGLNLASGPEDPNWFKARSVIGKRANFSLIFGIGWKKFRDDVRRQAALDLGVKRAKEIKYGFDELYPEYKAAIQTHMDIAAWEHRIRIRDDVWRYFTAKEIQYEDFHKAFNNRVQGNIGMLTKAWMTEVDEYLMDEGIDPDLAGLLLQIHDALALMLPDTPEGDQLAHDCAQIGDALWAEWFEVPGGVDLKVGLV